MLHQLHRKSFFNSLDRPSLNPAVFHRKTKMMKVPRFRAPAILTTRNFNSGSFTTQTMRTKLFSLRVPDRMNTCYPNRLLVSSLTEASPFPRASSGSWPSFRTITTESSSTSSPSDKRIDPDPSSSKKQPSGRPDRNLVSFLIFVITGISLFVYFKNEKLKVEERKREEMANKSVGKVKVGGPFELLNVATGEKFTDRDLLGKFTLIYFGFTNCPDICPEELDKMSDVVTRIREDKFDIPIQPVFVSVDPNRDTPDAIVSYLKDFHPSMIGLTGTFEAIKSMCKVYRVYFSTPPNLKPTDDYLVDHSIFFYLMAPNGNFVDAFGKIFNQDEVYQKVKSSMTEWSKGKRFGEEES